MNMFKKIILALSISVVSLCSYGQLKLAQDSVVVYPDLKLRNELYLALADTATDDTLGMYTINGWVYTTNLNSVPASWAFDYPMPPLFIKMIDANKHGDFRWPFKNTATTIVAPRKLDPLEGQQQLMAQVEFLHRYLLRTQLFFTAIISLLFIYFSNKEEHVKKTS